MTISTQFRDEIIAAIPGLRAFGLSLTARSDRADGFYSSKVAVHAEQDGHLDMADLRVALAKLPEDQREAIILVGASGFSYEEAADICSVAVGTIKSRVNRARARLAVLLQIGGNEKFGPDASSEAILINAHRN